MFILNNSYLFGTIVNYFSVMYKLIYKLNEKDKINLTLKNIVNASNFLFVNETTF